jgi:hypothetical protein
MLANEVRNATNALHLTQEIFSTATCSKGLCRVCKLAEVVDSGTRQVSKRDLEKLVGHFTNVTDLRIRHCQALEPECLDYLGRMRPSLRALRLEDLRRIKDANVMELSQRCKQLRVLGITGGATFLKSQTLIHLSKRNELVKLRLGGCRTMTDDDLHAMLQQMPALIQLQLDGCSALVRPTLRSCHICSLDLGQCSKLEAPILLMTSLTYLELSHCRMICDNVVETALSSCPQLRHLLLVGCASLSQPVIVSSKLVELKLDLCQSLQSVALM